MKNLHCPQCAAPISKRWWLLSGKDAEYQCPNCKSVLYWTKFRTMMNVIMSITIVTLFLFLYSYFLLNMYLIVLIVCAIGLVLILFFPGQCAVKEGKSGSNKQEQWAMTNFSILQSFSPAIKRVRALTYYSGNMLL